MLLPARQDLFKKHKLRFSRQHNPQNPLPGKKQQGQNSPSPNPAAHSRTLSAPSLSIYVTDTSATNKNLDVSTSTTISNPFLNPSKSLKSTPICTYSSLSSMGNSGQYLAELGE